MNPAYYAFHALLTNQMVGYSFKLGTPLGSLTEVDGRELLDPFWGINGHNVRPWVDPIVLCAMLVALRLVQYALLRWKWRNLKLSS